MKEQDAQPASASDLFELRVEIPIARLSRQAERLIGFSERYGRLHRGLRLLLDLDGLEAWSRQHYGKVLPLIESVRERYPLVILHGDVGTGKTATAEAAANSLATEIGAEGTLFKLSTRVRGTGMVGQMTWLIAQAFDVVTSSVGKKRIAVLIIDEADSLGSSRETDQSHHEDKAAVNTLIQRIDDTREFSGRILVVLCTNRYDSLDPAILRRASGHEEFLRPNDQERRALFELDCAGLSLPDSTLAELVAVTAAQDGTRPGFTYSDIRTRLLPDAMARAFPSRALSSDDLLEVAREMAPSPSMASG